MRVTETISHRRAADLIAPHLLEQVLDCIHNVDAEQLRTKISREKGMLGRALFSPVLMNSRFRALFAGHGWKPLRRPRANRRSDEIDFMCEQIGLEVEFGKYAFVAHDLLLRLPMFFRLGLIHAGIEILPAKALSRHMSSGVATIEHGRDCIDSNPPMPILILAVAA